MLKFLKTIANFSKLSLLITLIGIGPISAQAVTSDWSGPYVGLTGGYLSSQSNWTTQSIKETDSSFPSYSASYSVPVDSTSSQALKSSGAQIGAFGGYNWRVNNYVIGIEGDFNWADISSSKNSLPGATYCPSSGNCPGYTTSGDSTSVKLGWNASLRPRLGYLLTPDTLLYGTAGLAIQSVKISQTCQFSLSDPACSVMPNNPSSTATNNYTTLGYTFGAGLEKMIDAWLIRAEYRYTQYSNINVNSYLSASSGGDSTSITLNSNVRISTQLINLGIAYKF